MTLRAIVHDGLIVVNTHGAIADGTTVEIVVSNGVPNVPKGRGAKSPSAKGKKSSRRAKTTETPGYGMWADRAELGPSEDAVDRLRALTRRRRVG